MIDRGRGRRATGWRSCAAAFVALAALLGCDGPSGSADVRPGERLILIVVDTLRRDFLSVYGAKADTPNIAALASRGQVFSNFSASFHQTSMSMGSLFTGRTPSLEFNRVERPLFWNSVTWCGLNRFATDRDETLCIPPQVPTLAEDLQAAGYWTIGIASNQFLYEPSGFSRGFDTWVEVGEKPEQTGALARLKLPDASKTRFFRRVNEAAIRAVDGRESDRFFLYVHYMDVHDYGNTSVQRYAKAVHTVDWAIGDLLASLEERGLMDDTRVVLTSDHGERLHETHAVAGKPGHTGNPSFRELLAVPLVIAPPSDRDPDAFLRTQDLHGLILELAGLEPGARDGDGSGGGKAAPGGLAADELYLSEFDYRTYQRGRFKSSLKRDDGSLLLFDLEADPGETRNVVSEHPDVADRHRTRIAEIAESLSARRAVVERLTEDDRERLRALGYLEQLESPD